MIILDTDVTSELMKPAPSEPVVAWMRSQRADELYTTSITLAEVLYGIERLPDGGRKQQLRIAGEDVFSAFAEHVLAFDVAAASAYSRIVSDRERAGASIDGFDAQIAAISRVHGAQLATRNVKHFRDTGIEVVNPWLFTV